MTNPLPHIFRAHITSITLVLLCLINQLPAKAKPVLIDGIAATVNGRVITRSELASIASAQEKMIRTIFANEPQAMKQKLEELRSTALDNLIDRELILTEFQNKGGIMKEHYIEEDIAQIIRKQFKGDKDLYLKELAKIGLSPKRFREMREKMLIVQFMRQANTGEIAPPTPQEIQNYYTKNIKEFTGTPSINLSSISLPKQDAYGVPSTHHKLLAKELRERIQQGDDFKQLAKTYSMDSMAAKGGSWGWVKPQDLSLGLSTVAFALPTRQASKVLDNSGHYVILYVNERRPGKVTPLSEVRDTVEKKLRQEQGSKKQEMWLDALRRDAMIRKY